MLLKLSMKGIKSRLRDYIILFFGLVIASAIFYMFEAIATNKDFLESNSPISATVQIFQFGSSLLSIVTFFYILYANSFLMTIRQKDYALFLMLGAKVRKIAQMIFIETFMIGLIATLLGSVIGVSLTQLVSKLLTNQLGLTLSHFSAFNLHGLLITLVFFMILFLLAAILNALSIAKKPILTLLRINATPNRLTFNKKFLLLKAILGIGLIAIGYYITTDIYRFKQLGILISLIATMVGTYLIFNSVLIFLLTWLKKMDSISLKQLTNFTLSQLSFRIREYTQMLSMVTILLALSLGALTVGLSFNHLSLESSEGTSRYDLVLNNSQKMNQTNVNDLKPTLNVTYSQKENKDCIYYINEEFDRHPLLVNNREDNKKVKKIALASQGIKKIKNQQFLKDLELPNQKEKQIKLVSQSSFNQLPFKISKLQVIQVKNFEEKTTKIRKLATQNKQLNLSYDQMNNMPTEQKIEVYDTMKGLYSGFIFMGFFLGIAFLTMLASCLMFKILSGATSDIIRYNMLKKIGARQYLLKQSITKEIAVLFLAPGSLGVIHVLFGLQLFNSLLNPYQGIWLPFSIFFILYFLYFILTVWLYQSIVLKNEK